MRRKPVKTFREITIEDLPKLWRDRTQDMGYWRYRKKVYKFHFRINKHALYYLTGQKCRRPYCRERDINNLTIDHVVPIVVAYHLNWSIAEVRAYTNVQLLCRKHHTEKDRNVPFLRLAAWKLHRRKKYVPSEHYTA